MLLLLYNGHVTAAVEGSALAAIAVHASWRLLLMPSSWAVALQLPLGTGWFCKFPNTKGISPVCVAPTRESASCGRVPNQVHDDVCWNSYAQTGILFCKARLRPL